MMYASSFMDVFPLGVLYLVIAAFVLGSMELGWRLGNRRRQRSEEEKKAPVGAAVGSTLGLLAFLLAFTFGMAASRFDTRKQNVLAEANAIGTTYLRVDFLPEQSRQQARRLLSEYVRLRAGGASAIASAEGMAQSAALQDRLWAIAAEAEMAADTVATGLFVQSLNEMIDMDAVRLAGLRNRIPDSIWMMLFVVTIFSMAAMGYEFGLTGTHSWTVTILLTVAFTTVMLLIADLDRPQTGLLQVSQQPLIDLADKIGSVLP